MRYKIEYCWIQSDHILASPALHHSQIVDVDSREKLDKFICQQKDGWGNPYKKDKSMGFDYISRQGGVRIKEYKSPKIKKI